jgi:hypothetical protein
MPPSISTASRRAVWQRLARVVLGPGYPDGTRVDALGKTESLGTTPIGCIQLGDNSAGRIYDVALDNAAAHTTFIDMTPIAL